MMVAGSVCLRGGDMAAALLPVPTCLERAFLTFPHCLPGMELTHRQERVVISMQGRYWEESCLHATALDVFL